MSHLDLPVPRRSGSRALIAIVVLVVLMPVALLLAFIAYPWIVTSLG